MQGSLLRIFCFCWILVSPCACLLAGGQTLARSSCAEIHDAATLEERTGNLIRAEAFEGAECNARRLTALTPGSANGHYLLGYILFRMNQPAASLAEYTAAARLRRPTGNDLSVVALDYALLNDDNSAEKWMTEAILIDSGNALYWYYLGRIEYHLNAFADARKAFAMSRKLRPDDLRPIYNLGLTLEALDDTTHAAQLFREAIAQEQNSAVKDPQPYLDLGSLLLKQGDLAGATAMLQEALARDPGNPATYEALGKAEEQARQLEASRKYFEQATALAPDISSLHFELGRVEQKLHDVKAAKQQFALCESLLGAHSNDSVNLDLNTAR
jgi:tetratricopeptide (TPR) repeat protein